MTQCELLHFGFRTEQAKRWQLTDFLTSATTLSVHGPVLSSAIENPPFRII
jgi:hypothetical protein